jgi:hypothetical protein
MIHFRWHGAHLRVSTMSVYEFLDFFTNAVLVKVLDTQQLPEVYVMRGNLKYTLRSGKDVTPLNLARFKVSGTVLFSEAYAV